MNEDDILGARRKALEESFFRRRNFDLLEKLRAVAAHEALRDAMAMCSGITDQALLDRLIELDFACHVVSALSLVPLVRVAWADGKLDAKERKAILSAASSAGISEDCTCYKLLNNWLDVPPDQQLADAWCDYVATLSKQLSAEDREALKTGFVNRAREVAEAAGGRLGLGQKISDAEAQILAELEHAFDVP